MKDIKRRSDQVTGMFTQISGFTVNQRQSKFFQCLDMNIGAKIMDELKEGK